MVRVYTSRPIKKEKAETSTNNFDGKDVINLSDKSFQQTSSDRFKLIYPGSSNIRKVLILFYAPWCVHCNLFKDTYIKIARAINAEGAHDILVAAVNCEEYTNTSRLFNIDGFPTLACLSLPNGKLDIYEGPRTEEAVLNFIGISQSKSPEPMRRPGDFFGPEVLELTSSSYSTRLPGQLVNIQMPAIVLYYAPWCPFCTRIRDDWNKLAMKAGELGIKVCAVNCDKNVQVCQTNSSKGFPTIKLYTESSKAGIEYVGDRKVENFVAFIHRYTSPKDTMNKLNVPSQPPSRKQGTLALFFSHDCGVCLSESKHILNKIGRELKGSITTGMININEHPALAKELSIDAVPTFVLDVNGDIYKYVGSHDKKAIKQFVVDRLNGSYTRRVYIKFNKRQQEPIPFERDQMGTIYY